MPHEQRSGPPQEAAPNVAGQVDTTKTTPTSRHNDVPALTTDHLAAAAVQAFRDNTVIRICDTRRCVDVIPDIVIAEHVANGGTFRPTWLRVWSSQSFPGRVAYVYDAGVAA